jgi:HlyD family secretion protein
MRLVPLGVVLALASVGHGGCSAIGRAVSPPEVKTLQVSRGDIAEVVGATGTLEAVTTVQVGTQVSGTIETLSADFNSIVRKGQVVARLDPSLFETQTAQGRANLVRAEAEVERQRVALQDATNQLKRSRELSSRGMVADMELESSEAAVHAAQAQVQSSQAQVVQAQAALNQSAVNLQRTIIEAPIDGIVIARNVDVGQTVAASMQAPTLFVIAADLTRMRVVADIDESDVARIRPGQVARFRVDAYPGEEFAGTVTQVRLQPKVVQNVVTYSTVIDVPNLDLRLKPGMTATVGIEIARRTDAIRIPVAALRFRPSAELFASLNQAMPAEPPRDGLQGATPASPSAGPAGPVAAGQGTSRTADDAPARTADALFGPLPITRTRGRVWQFVEGRLEPVPVWLGISDGIHVEVLSGALEPGTSVVSAMAATAQPSGSVSRSPLVAPGRGPAAGSRPPGT